MRKNPFVFILVICFISLWTNLEILAQQTQFFPFIHKRATTISSYQYTYPHFVKIASLPPTEPISLEWYKIVHSHVSSSKTHNSVVSSFHGILKAFEAYQIRYQRISKYSHHPRVDHASHFRSPKQVLLLKRGNCVEISLLAAVTFSRLGFDTVLVTTSNHVVAGVLTTRPQEGVLSGIPFTLEKNRHNKNVTSKNMYLYPLETTFVSPRDYSLTESTNSAQKFILSSLHRHDTMMVNLFGKILWKTNISSFFAGGRLPTSLKFYHNLGRRLKLDLDLQHR